MSCSNEAHSHDHGHDHEGHDHDDPAGSGPQDSLFSQIDLPHVTALNAQGGAEAGQRIIKLVLAPYGLKVSRTTSPGSGQRTVLC